MTIYSILICARILCRDPLQKRVLWGVVLTHPVGHSRPPSVVNDPIATREKTIKTNSWKSFVCGFYPKIEHKPRSIISLCMHPKFSIFFELSWIPPRTTPLPPLGGRTRWLVPLLIFPDWQSLSRFSAWTGWCRQRFVEGRTILNGPVFPDLLRDPSICL